MLRRIRLTLAYDGTDFFGWQVQPERPTIQGELERVLSAVEGTPVRVAGSGRTDAGVHALAQVAAVSLRNPIPCDNLRRALNRLLPSSIRVTEASEAPPDFDPRRQAIAKTYEYRIWREEIPSPFERRYWHHHPYPLDAAAMIEAAPTFEGSHDFTAFAASDDKDEPGRSKVRTVFSSRVEAGQGRLIYRVRGSGFLKHMVRNLVGTLLEVGKGNLRAPDLAHLLVAGRGGKAGPTAAACGLFLVSVEYRTDAREEATTPARATEGA